MSEYLVQESTLTGLANAVRSKTGDTGNLTLSQITSKISNDLVKPIGNKSISANTSTQTGIDVSDYATVSVAPTPSESKTATANGTVTPSTGMLLSSVVVSIPEYDGSVS